MKIISALLFLFALALAAPASAQVTFAASAPPSGYVVSSSMQTTPRYPIGTQLTAQWDPYTAAELASNLADRWEVTVTGPTPGMATVAIGTTTFALPTLAAGTHTVAVRGCNAVPPCGPAATASLIIDPLVPGAPRNFRIEPVPEPVNLAQATAMAHAYSTLLQARALTDPELMWLVARYTQPWGSQAPPPLTRAGVLSFLDRVTVELLEPR